MKRIIVFFIFISVFNFGGFILNNQSPYVYAEENAHYICGLDGGVVYVVGVKRIDDNHFDTDVRFDLFDSGRTEYTHYEYIQKNSEWIYRTHRAENGPWRPVNHDRIAQSIFNYAYYNS